MKIVEGTCTDPELVRTLSLRLVKSLTDPCLDDFARMITDDFSIYYGFSNASLDHDEALSFFNSYFPTIQLRYDNIVCTPTASGWVQQHLVQTDGANGVKVRDLPVCMVVTLRGDKIAHIAEYLDSAQTGGFDASQMKSH